MDRIRIHMMILAIAMSFIASATFAQRKDNVSSTPGEGSYIVVLGSDTTFELTDSIFYNISRKVIFPVNKYEIPKSAEFRRHLQEELAPYLADSTRIVDRVYVRGAASPEGPRSWNTFLARHRAKALVDLIGENSSIGIKLPPQLTLVDEDYVYLLLLMKERADKEYDTVAEIVNRWVGKDEHTLKQQLINYEGGRLWRRLLREYFPQMRAARMVVVFRKIPRMKWHQRHTMTSEVQTAIAPIDIHIEPELMPEEPVVLPRRELLSVKTNLLLDAALTPNLAIEYYPMKGHFTFGASMDFPWWQNYEGHRYWQIRNYQLEARYYFKSGDVRKRGYGFGPAFRGWYLQAYVHAGLYNICFDANSGYEGEGLGAGLGIGYVMPLGKKSRWRLEFSLQAGFFRTWYDPYQWLCPVDPEDDRELYYYKWTGKPEDFQERQHRFTWFGPTRIGVTLTYDLLYRKRTKCGASFKNWEENKR